VQKKIFHFGIYNKLVITVWTPDKRFHILSGQRFPAGRTDQSSFLCQKLCNFYGGLFHNGENLHLFSVFSRRRIKKILQKRKKIPESGEPSGMEIKSG